MMKKKARASWRMYWPPLLSSIPDALTTAATVTRSPGTHESTTKQKKRDKWTRSKQQHRSSLLPIIFSFFHTLAYCAWLPFQQWIVSWQCGCLVQGISAFCVYTGMPSQMFEHQQGEFCLRFFLSIANSLTVQTVHCSLNTCARTRSHQFGSVITSNCSQPTCGGKQARLHQQ